MTQKNIYGIFTGLRAHYFREDRNETHCISFDFEKDDK